MSTHTFWTVNCIVHLSNKSERGRRRVFVISFDDDEDDDDELTESQLTTVSDTQNFFLI